jgi:hypothetical protein
MSEETAAERIARKREEAEQLRRDTALLELATRDAVAERQLEIEEAALDAELDRLKAEKLNAIRTAGGSVAEALAAMEQAQAVQRPPLAGASEQSNEPVVETVATPAAEVPVVTRPPLGETNTEGEVK